MFQNERDDPTYCGSSWSRTASRKEDPATRGTTGGERWSSSPSFYTNSWLMLQVWNDWDLGHPYWVWDWIGKVGPRVQMQKCLCPLKLGSTMSECILTSATPKQSSPQFPVKNCPPTWVPRLGSHTALSPTSVWALIPHGIPGCHSPG